MKRRNWFVAGSGALACFVLLAVCPSCHDTKENVLTEKAAMDSLISKSLIGGARFYRQNREEYPFLERLYKDSVLPAMTKCNYYELGDLYYSLRRTPMAAALEGLVEQSRTKLLEGISQELKQNLLLEQETFRKEVMPLMDAATDSLKRGNFRYANNIQALSDGYLNLVCANKREYVKWAAGKKARPQFDVSLQRIEMFDGLDSYAAHVLNNLQDINRQAYDLIAASLSDKPVRPTDIGNRRRGHSCPYSKEVVADAGFLAVMDSVNRKTSERLMPTQRPDFSQYARFSRFAYRERQLSLRSGKPKGK